MARQAVVRPRPHSSGPRQPDAATTLRDWLPACSGAQGSGVSRARSGVAGAVDGVSKIVAEGGGTLPLCKMVGVMVLLFLVVWFIFLR